MHRTEVVKLLQTSQPQVQFSVLLKILLLILLRFFDGTAQNSGRKLENVNQTHPVLAGSKLVLQKNVPRTMELKSTSQPLYHPTLSCPLCFLLFVLTLVCFHVHFSLCMFLCFLFHCPTFFTSLSTYRLFQGLHLLLSKF